MIGIALTLGIGIATLCSIAIRNGRGKWAITGLAGLLVFVVLAAPVVASLFLMFQVVLLLVVIGVGIWFVKRPAYLIAACWVTSAAVFAFAVLEGYGQVQQLRRWRMQYPFVSLADRLGYEARNRASEPSPSGELPETPAPIVLTAAMEKQLNSEDASSKYNYRQYQLERLHDERYEAFIATSGFGVGRMMRVHENGLKLDEERDQRARTPFGALLVDGLQSSQMLGEEVADPTAPGADFPHSSELKALTDGARQDFLNSERFGFVRNGTVSGFVSHRLVYLPGDSESDDGEETWRLSRLELVSLLKYPQPAVYLSDELPDMKKLADVPTRPLNDFGREALPKLRTDEDLVVRYSANTIRMLGSLRAGKTCLECHTVQRGALLGAFSYELRRTTPVPAPVQRPAKAKPEA